MPKRKAGPEPPKRGRPKRTSTNRRDPDFVYVSNASESTTELEVQETVTQQNTVPDLTEDQVDRIAAKVAQQLAGINNSHAAATVTSADTLSSHHTGPQDNALASQPNDECRSDIASVAVNNLLGELREVEVRQVPKLSAENMVLFDLPVDYHISLKTKSKIWANEFVDFAELLKTRDDDSFVMSVKNVDDVPSLSVTKSEKRSFLTYNQWCVAFEIFVAIHSMKYPNDTPGLMKYASLIRLLHTNGQGWYKYDRSFRHLRSLNPSVPWSKIKSTLWSVATLVKAPRVTPVAHDKLPQYNGPPFRRGPAEPESKGLVKGFCWSYNETGSCVLGWPNSKSCPHKHVCTACKGSHPRCLCHNRGGQQRKNPFKFERRRF